MVEGCWNLNVLVLILLLLLCSGLLLLSALPVRCWMYSLTLTPSGRSIGPVALKSSGIRDMGTLFLSAVLSSSDVLILVWSFRYSCCVRSFSAASSSAAVSVESENPHEEISGPRSACIVASLGSFFVVPLAPATLVESVLPLLLLLWPALRVELLVIFESTMNGDVLGVVVNDDEGVDKTD